MQGTQGRTFFSAGSAWTAPTWLAVLEAGAVAPLCSRHTCLPSQVAVREAAAYCIGEARAGKGPSVVEAHTLRTRRPRSRCGYIAPHNNRSCHDQALTFRHGSHNVGQNLPESTLSDDDREIRRKERLQMRQETSTRD